MAAKKSLYSHSSMLGAIRKRFEQGYLPPVARLVGFRMTQIQRGRAKIEIDVGVRHENPMGTLHGGIICDIADAAMGMSYASLLSLDESFATIELKMNFLRPVWQGHLVASGRVIRKGRTLGLVECKVTDEKGRLAAYATSTCMSLPGSPRQTLIRPKSAW